MRYISPMRTTLDVDEDVLQAAKELASQRGTTAGKVLSELARRALRPAPSSDSLRNGVPVLPARDGEEPVTSETVARLLDEG